MQNFLSGRKKVASDNAPKDAIQISTENPAMTKIEVAQTAIDQPKVELVTQEGTIKSIIVTCKCGERIELKCHY